MVLKFQETKKKTVIERCKSITQRDWMLIGIGSVIGWSSALMLFHILGFFG